MEDLGMFGIPSTIAGSLEWKELTDKENELGPDGLLDELLEKRNWSNAEMAWILRRMMYFYGRKDALLAKAPAERIFMNFNNVLRTFYLLLDFVDPELDDNMRSYISTKLAESTWGISTRTRDYLSKF